MFGFMTHDSSARHLTHKFFINGPQLLLQASSCPGPPLTTTLTPPSPPPITVYRSVSEYMQPRLCACICECAASSSSSAQPVSIATRQHKRRPPPPPSLYIPDYVITSVVNQPPPTVLQALPGKNSWCVEK